MATRKYTIQPLILIMYPLKIADFLTFQNRVITPRYQLFSN